MTTKRKLILTTLAKLGTSILDDLTEATRLQRKNLQDNLKACVDEGLVDKIKDDVTGPPAYKVSQKGLKWLANQNSSEPSRKVESPQPAVGPITPAAAHCATLLASATPGKGADVIEPPKPDDAPAAVCSDESSCDKPVVRDFRTTKKIIRTPLEIAVRNHNLLMSIADALGMDGDAAFASMPERVLDLQTMLADRAKSFDEACDTIRSLERHLADANRRGNEMAHELINTPVTCVEHMGYAIMPDYPDIILHQTLASARAEAEQTFGIEPGGPVHVVAIIDTAELAITWKRAA